MADRKTNSSEQDAHERSLPDEQFWKTVAKTPGIAVSIVTASGKFVFSNDVAKSLLLNRTDVDLEGRAAIEVLPKAYYEERLALITRVLREQHPIGIRQILHGRGFFVTIWPLDAELTPDSRVAFVGYPSSKPIVPDRFLDNSEVEIVESEVIGLGPLNVLSTRELEVLILQGQGLSVPDIATLIHRSVNTVQNHKETISKKLHLRGQAEIVALVTSIGLELGDVNKIRLDD